MDNEPTQPLLSYMTIHNKKDKLFKILQNKLFEIIGQLAVDSTYTEYLVPENLEENWKQYLKSININQIQINQTKNSNINIIDPVSYFMIPAKLNRPEYLEISEETAVKILFLERL